MTLAPCLPQVMQTFAPTETRDTSASLDYGGVSDLASFSVTVYMIGLAIGMLVFGSLSDIFGRLRITQVTGICYVAASVGCALAPSLDALIALRGIAGCFGGAAQVIGNTIVADLYPEGQRDTPLAFYAVGPVFGPALGSVVGSLINSAVGWRWVFWLATILVRPRYMLEDLANRSQSGLYTVSCFLCLKETHAPTLLAASAKTDHEASPSRTSRQWLLEAVIMVGKALYRPARIVLLPAVSLVMLHVALLTGWFNVLISSLGTVYQEVYRFPLQSAGFGYIAICIGSVMSLFCAKPITKKLAKHLPKTTNASAVHPANDDLEHCNYLPMLVLATIVAAIGWLIFGWACQEQIHWIVSMIGLLVYGLSGSAVRVSGTSSRLTQADRK